METIPGPESRIWILEQAGLPSLGQVISVVEDLAVRAWRRSLG